MKVTIIETLAYTIDVKDADEKTTIAIAKETFEHGDISYSDMTDCCTEYKINDDDSVDMELDKDGNILNPEEWFR